MRKPKGKTVLRTADGPIVRIEPHSRWDYLYLNGYAVKLTTAVARKLVTAIYPYTEWLPPGTEAHRQRREGR